MKRPAGIALTAMLTLSLAFLGIDRLSAQDEKKPGKKPTPEKKEKDEEKKNKDGEDKKNESKSDADKAPEPTDEKQAKQFKRIRDDLEKKFRKSKREMVYVYATVEKTMERIEPTEEAAPEQPPQGKGRAGKPNAGGGVGGAGFAAQYEPNIKYQVYSTKEREDAIEKVYKFLVEFPPPLPGAKKKRGKVEDEPPPPERALFGVQTFNATKEGEKQAEAAQEQLENKFRKEMQAQDWKKQARKKK